MAGRLPCAGWRILPGPSPQDGQQGQLADPLSTFSSSSAQHSLHFRSAQHFSFLPDPDPLEPFISLGGEEFAVEVDRGLSAAATYQQSAVPLSCLFPRDWISSICVPEYLLPMA